MLTSNAFRRRRTAFRTVDIAFRIALYVGYRPLDAVDDEDVHAISRRLEPEPELFPEGPEDRWSIRTVPGVDTQVVRTPLNFPVEFPGEARVID